MPFLITVSDTFRKFIISVYRSCWDVDYYRRIRTSPMRYSIRYALMLYGLLIVALSLALAFAAFSSRTRLISYIDAHIPENGEFMIKGGQLSTTLANPFEIGDEKFHYLVDTSVTGTAFPDDRLHNEGFLFGQDAIFTRSTGGIVRAYPLAGVPDMQIAQYDAINWLNKGAAVTIIVATLAIMLFLAVYFFVTVLVYVTVFSLITWVIAKLWGVNLRYSRWFSMGLHAITLPNFLKVAFVILGLNVPYATGVIFFLFMAAIITDERNVPTQQTDMVIPERLTYHDESFEEYETEEDIAYREQLKKEREADETKQITQIVKAEVKALKAAEKAEIKADAEEAKQVVQIVKNEVKALEAAEKEEEEEEKK